MASLITQKEIKTIENPWKLDILIILVMSAFNTSLFYIFINKVYQYPALNINYSYTSV